MHVIINRISKSLVLAEATSAALRPLSDIFDALKRETTSFLMIVFVSQIYIRRCLSSIIGLKNRGKSVEQECWAA